MVKLTIVGGCGSGSGVIVQSQFLHESEEHLVDVIVLWIVTDNTLHGKTRWQVPENERRAEARTSPEMSDHKVGRRKSALHDGLKFSQHHAPLFGFLLKSYSPFDSQPARQMFHTQSYPCGIRGGSAEAKGFTSKEDAFAFHRTPEQSIPK